MALDIDEATLRAAFDLRVRERPPPRERFPSDAEPRPAAVLLPISRAPAASIVAVVRAATMRDHAGEVGFAGGKRDEGDVDLAATALREAREEIGIGSEDVELLGALTPMPVITGRFWLHPYVGLLREGARPAVASSENARLVEIPIAPWIEGARTIAMVDTVWRRTPMRVPHFELEDAAGARCVMYGASACALYEALARIAAALGRELPPARVTLRPPWGDRYRDFE